MYRPPSNAQSRSLATLAFCCLSWLLGTGTAAAVDAPERAALVELYNSTGGPGWTHRDGWLGPEGTECTWWGVTCGEGHVLGLELAGNNLSGVLPDSIRDLESLEVLDLNYNRGLKIPSLDPIYELTRLRVLLLNEPQTTGVLDERLCSLSQLEQLLLLPTGAGTITGSIPACIGNLSKLQSLNLYSLSLTGEIPRTLWSIASLRSVGIGTNLSVSIPPEMCNLPRLEVLYVSGVISTPDCFDRLPLTVLALFNRETMQLPLSVFRVQTLTRLVLGGSWTGTLPESMTLPSLTSLHLERVRTRQSFPAAICGLPNLETLQVYESDFTGSLPDCIGNLTKLKSLWLADNLLDRRLPDSIGNLVNLEELFWVNLRVPRHGRNGSWGADQIHPLPASLGNCTHLRRLVLPIGIAQPIPDTLANLTSLRELHLEGSPEDTPHPFPSWIASLPSLEWLQYWALPTEDPVPPGLFNGHIWWISLFQCGFTGEIPAGVSQASLLQSLDLYGNRLTGQVPTDLMNLPTLTWLNLDYNALEIPPEGPFLDWLRAMDPNFEYTQTLPPEDVHDPGGSAGIAISGVQAASGSLSVADQTVATVTFLWTPHPVVGPDGRLVDGEYRFDFDVNGSPNSITLRNREAKALIMGGPFQEGDQVCLRGISVTFPHEANPYVLTSRQSNTGCTSARVETDPWLICSASPSNGTIPLEINVSCQARYSYFDVEVDFGDGISISESAPGGQFSVAHTFTTPGRRTVRVRAEPHSQAVWYFEFPVTAAAASKGIPRPRLSGRAATSPPPREESGP